MVILVQLEPKDLSLLYVVVFVLIAFGCGSLPSVSPLRSEL